MESQEILDLAIGAENLRRMFRQTMAANARLPGETVEQTHARLVSDPATARVAKTLGCTAAELLEGFGRREEVFYVSDDYDREQAEAAVDAIVERVANTAMGTNDPRIGDVLERSRDRGTKMIAPHVEQKRGQVFGDAQAQKQIELARRQWPKPRAPISRRR